MSKSRDDDAVVLKFRQRNSVDPNYMTCECGHAWFNATVSFGPADANGDRRVNAYGIRDAAGVPQVTCASCGKEANFV